MICLEAPGTVTMEMPDIPAIVAAARQRSILTMMDNTWASPLAFRPIEAGVDLCVEAATKFFSGHSDVLLGAISMNDHAYYEVLRQTQSTLGMQASPDDCFLVLRGLETLHVRYAAQSSSALDVAGWLQEQALVERVLFPALPGDPGHAIWKRDFAPGGCLFSLMLRPAPDAAYSAFFSALKRFAIGASWGGVHSLAAYYPASQQRDRLFPLTDQPVIRLSIGLEPVRALKDDLSAALAAFERTAGF
jgi:cystathionine beta-lyase